MGSRRGGGPDRLGADHRGGGAQLRLQQPQVEDRHQRLVGEQVVALIGEQVAEATGGEGAEQLRQIGVALLAVAQVGEEVAEAGALARLRVVGGESVVEGGAPLGAEGLSHHHLDQPPQAADAQQQFLRVAAVDDEGVHALAGDARGEHAPTRGACHVGVLALGVDHVGRHASADAAQHAELGREGEKREEPDVRRTTPRLLAPATCPRGRSLVHPAPPGGSPRGAR